MEGYATGHTVTLTLVLLGSSVHVHVVAAEHNGMSQHSKPGATVSLSVTHTYHVETGVHTWLRGANNGGGMVVFGNRGVPVPSPEKVYIYACVYH